MSNQAKIRQGRGTARRVLIIGAVASVAVTGSLVVAPVGAYADATGTGTTTSTITGGSLSVGTIGSMTGLTPVIGEAVSGALPSAQWADATGSGAGWNGTVAISPLSYTGNWVASAGATALKANTAGTFTGIADGVSYTVTVTSATSNTGTNFSYTSTDSDDPSGTEVTATNGTATAVGKLGLTITFDTVNTTVGKTYTVLAGTQSASSLTVNPSSAGAITSSYTATATAPPTYPAGTSTIAAGSTVNQVNTTGAVKILTALAGTGASGSSGYFTAAPGVTITADSNSWAHTYSGSLQYSIVTGP